MKSTAFRDLLFGLLGALSLLGGVLLADAMFDDAVVSLPVPESSFVVQLSEGADAEDPGTILAPVSVAAPTPSFEGETLLVPVIYDEEGNSLAAIPAASSPDGASSGSGSSGDGSASDGSPTTTASPSPPGAAAGSAMATIVRFFDLCAENPAVGCPPGLGATVLFGSPGPQPPPLQIRILPDATPVQFPGLRCDPGWPTATVIPVVLLSNRPLSRGGGVTLRTGDGMTVLDQAPQGTESLKSPPSEHTLYDQRRLAGKPFAATVAEGYHTCLQLRLFDRPGVSVPDRNSTFELTAAGHHDDGIPATQDGVVATVKFTGNYHPTRPPVRIIPQDEDRAVVFVPQLPDEARTDVWVTVSYAATGPNPTPGCGPVPAQSLLRRDPLTAPAAVAKAIIEAPDYPWDRTYSLYTVWDLSLRHSGSYRLCVHWTTEDVTEEWILETPDGVSIFIRTDQDVLDNTQSKDTDFRIETSGCGVSRAMARELCATAGKKLAPTFVLQALIREDGPEIVYGGFSVPTAAVIAKCTWRGPNADKSPCARLLEWRSQNTLCGGSYLFPPTNCGDVFAYTWITFIVVHDTQTNRANPLDWGISKIARLGEQSDTVPLP